MYSVFNAVGDQAKLIMVALSPEKMGQYGDKRSSSGVTIPMGRGVIAAEFGVSERRARGGNRESERNLCHNPAKSQYIFIISRLPLPPLPDGLSHGGGHPGPNAVQGGRWARGGWTSLDTTTLVGWGVRWLSLAVDPVPRPGPRCRVHGEGRRRAAHHLCRGAAGGVPGAGRCLQ